MNLQVSLRRRAAFLASVFFQSFLLSLSAQTELTRLGEFKVNVTVDGAQLDPIVAEGPNGTALVVWTGTGGIADGADIFAQRYNAAGSPVGPEFRVNDATPANQVTPAAAYAPDGRFIVVWQSDETVNDPSLRGIHGRLFEADGTPKIVIFLAQVVLLFFVVDRLRTVSERLEETRRALMDLADRLPAGKGEP